MFRKLRRRLFRVVVVSGAGAAAQYFFDRDRGDARRAQAKDKASSLVGRVKAGDSQGPYVSDFAGGQGVDTAPTEPPAPPAGGEVAAGVEQPLIGADAGAASLTTDPVPDAVTSPGPILSPER